MLACTSGWLEHPRIRGPETDCFPTKAGTWNENLRRTDAFTANFSKHRTAASRHMCKGIAAHTSDWVQRSVKKKSPCSALWSRADAIKVHINKLFSCLACKCLFILHPERHSYSHSLHSTFCQGSQCFSLVCTLRRWGVNIITLKYSAFMLLHTAFSNPFFQLKVFYF